MADSEQDLKEVRFDLYCPKCLYADDEETCEACAECLQHPANEHSCKPVRYVKKRT